MLDTIILDNPIKINGEVVKDLKYDFDELDVEDYANAEAAKASSMGSSGAMVQKVAQIDSTLHIYLAMAAVIAVNKSFTYIDLKKIRGFDLNKLMKVGQSFFTGPKLQVLEQNSSENSQENMQDITDVQ